MKLDQIVAELNGELDKLEKDDKIGKIAAYVNESWKQKGEFIQYLFEKYSTKIEGNGRKNEARRYFYGAAAFTAGVAVASYDLFKIPPINSAILVFLFGYLSLSTAAEIAKNKTAALVKDSLEYAIKEGNFKEDLNEFYKNIKD
ncbi:MAG: hypothetical protein ACP5MV_04615 [Candidatus Parvarchaeum sp.]